MKVLNEILKDIRPSEREKKAILWKVDRFIKKIKIPAAKAVLGGSGAKNTWLSGQFDADIFVMFDLNKYKNKDISGILEKNLKKKFKIARIHGSRDYFQVKEKNFIFEVIPILKISKAEQARNITDVSVLHANFVKKNINENLADEIRLLKKFCRANDVYGAESYVQGFSGYVCELLVIYYGSFIKVLQNSIKWKSKDVIDIKKYYKNKNEIFHKINKSKLQSPLIIIDPVQKDRNASAALSYERFEIFRQKAKEFLKKPSKKYFEKEKFSIEKLQKKAKNKRLIILDVQALSGKEDIVGSKLLKCLKYIAKKLEENDFKVYDYNWHWDKKKNAMFYFILGRKELPKVKKQFGPPVKLKEAVKNFKRKYGNIYSQRSRVYALTKRRFTKPEGLIKFLILTDENVKARVKRIMIMKG